MIDFDASHVGASALHLPPKGDSLKFGTSGLRGLVTDLVGLQSRAYALAFVRHMLRAYAGAAATEVLVGRDLRSSSPQIALDCAAAINLAGLAAVDCGELPTPALALEAQRRGCPAIMVTGSHIPDDRNGLKFYRPEGEITKHDEAAIVAAYDAFDNVTLAALAAVTPYVRQPHSRPLENYLERYLRFFGPRALHGMRVGVYQHSSVARDLLVELLAGLGAEPVSFARASRFIPVDTEAYDPEQADLIAGQARYESLAAVVSTDGDADRPLVADELGRIVRGDVLGLVAAAFVGSDAIVTPVTSGSVIERSRLARQVVRTRVGSPYVIEGMGKMAGSGHTVVGFEANGGVLLGTDAVRNGRPLAALPTRDAFLPIIAVLSLANEKGCSVSQLVADLDVGFALADRLKNIPSESSHRLLLRLESDRAYAGAFFSGLGPIRDVDDLDGVRFELGDSSILHYRASGNAPELRCYVEAKTPERAEELLAWGLKAAGRALEPSHQRPV